MAIKTRFTNLGIMGPRRGSFTAKGAAAGYDYNNIMYVVMYPVIRTNNNVMYLIKRKKKEI